MQKATKRFRKFLFGAILCIAAFIVFLEIGSKNYVCPITEQDVSEALVCNPNSYPVDQAKARAIQVLFESKRQGREPSREDLDRVINLVSAADMPGLNGVECGNGMIFIRDNLGNEARYFVARHELEHAFRSLGMSRECSKEEYCATISAARVYPVGFIETIFASLYASFKASPTVWCFLFGSWKIFRSYIFPW